MTTARPAIVKMVKMEVWGGTVKIGRCAELAVVKLRWSG